jgi:DNA-binding NarL/FixJ family response regulator
VWIGTCAALLFRGDNVLELLAEGLANKAIASTLSAM